MKRDHNANAFTREAVSGTESWGISTWAGMRGYRHSFLLVKKQKGEGNAQNEPSRDGSDRKQSFHTNSATMSMEL